MTTDGRRENGVALVIALLLTLLLSVLGAVLVLTTSSETLISGNFRNASEGLYAADAVIEGSMDDLANVADWNALLDGSMRSGFIDGPPGGARTLLDGSTIELTQALSMANCGKVSMCSDADLVGNRTGDRPWGANNPVWQLYAYGKLQDLVPTGTINSPYYIMLMVADDPSESDGDPLRDGSTPCSVGQIPPACNPGTGVVTLRAEAFGPRGAHKVIEVTVAHTDASELERGYIRILSWREVR